MLPLVNRTTFWLVVHHFKAIPSLLDFKFGPFGPYACRSYCITTLLHLDCVIFSRIFQPCWIWSFDCLGFYASRSYCIKPLLHVDIVTLRSSYNIIVFWCSHVWNPLHLNLVAFPFKGIWNIADLDAFWSYRIRVLYCKVYILCHWILPQT